MGKYEDVVAGMNANFATVLGASNVLDYEPNTIHRTPLLYTIFYRMRLGEKGQRKATHYELLHRLCVVRQDAKQSEHLVKPYVDSLVEAVEANPRLNNGSIDVLSSGLAVITEVRGGYADIGGVIYRVLDIYSDCLYKRGIVRA